MITRVCTCTIHTCTHGILFTSFDFQITKPPYQRRPGIPIIKQSPYHQASLSRASTSTPTRPLWSRASTLGLMKQSLYNTPGLIEQSLLTKTNQIASGSAPPPYQGLIWRRICIMSHLRELPLHTIADQALSGKAPLSGFIEQNLPIGANQAPSGKASVPGLIEQNLPTSANQASLSRTSPPTPTRP